MRTIIFHYHLFKNAGTSIDEILKRNFPGQWTTREFPTGNPTLNRKLVAEWIEEESDMVVFSSHTALLPPPKLKSVRVLPIIFVRHPLDRIASVYRFERRQEINTFETALARNTTLRGYVEVRLAIPQDRQCRNFHVAHLARMFESESTELDRARLALKELPFIGLVEKFQESLDKLQLYLRGSYPEFKAEVVVENATQDVSKTLDDRLASIREELGDETYRVLLSANSEDLEIFHSVSAIYEKANGER